MATRKQPPVGQKGQLEHGAKNEAPYAPAKKQLSYVEHSASLDGYITPCEKGTGTTTADSIKGI